MACGCRSAPIDAEFTQDGPAAPDGSGQTRWPTRNSGCRRHDKYYSQRHRHDRGFGQCAERIIGPRHGDDSVFLVRGVSRSFIDVRMLRIFLLEKECG